MLVLNFLAKIVNAVVIVIELMLSVRFVLLLLRVSPSSDFLVWIQKTTSPLAAPFSSFFQDLTFVGLTINFSTLFALIAYGIAGIILVKLISHPTR